MAEEDASKNVPHVIKFVYEDFITNEVKKIHTAKCKRCRAAIREKMGTTSAFVNSQDLIRYGCLGVGAMPPVPIAGNGAITF